MKTKKKKHAALEIAIAVTIAAGRGGAKNTMPAILQESYHVALALLDELDRDQDDDTPTQQNRGERE